ncbi:hypothetical protein ABES02_10645 [Neobacillus pocheonensis]|uniref:hypothetical protein n=1 Tax=Neobacillus pocheonensis TaxID=363869 RepID=UPI003D2CBC91
MSIGIVSYLALLLLAIFAAGTAYWKCRNPRLFILFFAVSGLTMFFDYLIYVWGKAYTYHPDITDGKYDTHLGAIVNGLILPAFAVLYVAFNGKWYGSVLLAGFFSGIEFLFKEWGVYKSNWWKIWYTFSLLIFYFPIIKIWWGRVTNSPGKWLSYWTLFSFFFVLYVQLNILIYGLLELKTFHVEWIEHLHRDSAALNSINALLFSSILAFLCILHARQFWYYLMLCVYIIYYFILKNLGIIQTDHLFLDFIFSFIAFLIPLVAVKYAGPKIVQN